MKVLAFAWPSTISFPISAWYRNLGAFLHLRHINVIFFLSKCLNILRREIYNSYFSEDVILGDRVARKSILSPRGGGNSRRLLGRKNMKIMQKRQKLR
jgi:hypothetical protein